MRKLIFAADELASRAIKIDPDYHTAHAAKGDALVAAGRYRDAIHSYERAQFKGGYDLNEVRLAYVRHLRKIASGRAGGSGADQLTAQRVRLATAKAEREERQNAIERGDVCYVVFVRRFLEYLLLDVRNLLLNLPGEVSFLLALREQTEVYETLDAKIREKLEAIADPKAVAARATAIKANALYPTTRRMTNMTMTQPPLANDGIPLGIRIAENGHVELMTAIEVQMALARAFNAALRILRPAHRDHNAVQTPTDKDVIADLLRTNEQLQIRIAELEYPTPIWMQLKDAAFECCLGYEFLRKRVARGQVEARREGGRWLVNIVSLKLRVAQGRLC